MVGVLLATAMLVLVTVGLSGFSLKGVANATTLAPTANPWQVTADKISRFDNPPGVIAEGHVVLVREGVASIGQIDRELMQGSGSTVPQKPLTINGDWVRLDPGANQIKVRGHFILDSEDEHVTADYADLDMDRQTGRLQQATIYFPKRSLYLSGEDVQKTGDLTYHLENGWITKCDPEQGKAPPWQFNWRRADIAQGGLAQFRHATFRVKDTPLIYTPYFAFPTSTQRQTGFLLPELSGSTRDGAGVLVPFFVDISPSQDFTLYAGGLSDRGPQAAVEYRYVKDRNSKGTIALNFLNDRLADSVNDDFKSDGIYRTQANRYWLRGKGDHDFGDSVTGKLDIDFVSDSDFLQEYPDGIIGYAEGNRIFSNHFGRGLDAKTTQVRSNFGQLNKLWPAMSLTGEVRGVNDPTEISSTSHPWSLPRIAFSGSRPLVPGRSKEHGFRSLISDTDLTWDTGYVYYWREDGVGEQRLDLHPVLKAPLPISPYLETTVGVGLRQTMYQVDDNGMTSNDYGSGVLNRTLSDVSLGTSTIFMRDFAMDNSYLQRFTHMVRPELSYAYLPSIDQNDLPSVDSEDRIGAQNLLTYGVRNDFDVLGRDNSAWKFGYASLSQSYDIHEDRRELLPEQERRSFANVTFDSWVQPVPRLRVLYQTEWDVYEATTAYYLTGVSYANQRDDSILVSYQYNGLSDINQLNLNFGVRLARTLMAEASINHSLETSETTDSALRLIYQPECWGMALQASTTPDESYRFTLLFSLEGIGNIFGLSQTLSFSGAGVTE